MKYLFGILILYFYIDRRPKRVARREKRRAKRAKGFNVSGIWRMYGF
ncbi:MAG: hypothetical protein K5860_09880 [Bacteroidales bacterium]|nr:hypothetical protein [Bacteroidales bacterium]